MEEVAAVSFLFYLFGIKNDIIVLYEILSDERTVPVRHIVCFKLPVTSQRFGNCLISAGLGESDSLCTA